jgi:CDP-diacylglycerol--glycerol-3-phosphate 3-phosphatidyltransferase
LHAGGGGAAAAWRQRQLAWRQRLSGGRWLARGGAASAAGGAGAAAAHGACGTPSRRLWEYCREGWEFHAKGIWVHPPEGQPPAAGASHGGGGGGGAAAADAAGWAPPLATAVGSSNYGFRSLHRDLELQFILVTRNPALRAALGAEAAALKAHSQPVADAALLAPGRRGGPMARLAVRLLRGFL